MQITVKEEGKAAKVNRGKKTERDAKTLNEVQLQQIQKQASYPAISSAMARGYILTLISVLIPSSAG